MWALRVRSRGEAQRVADGARGDLVVAHEAGQDRQPGGVGRVQPSGRRRLERRFQTAPEPASSSPPLPVAAYSS